MATKFKQIKIVPFKREVIRCTVSGLSPLLTQPIPDPVIENIRRKACGLPTIPVKPTYEQLYEWCLYPHPDPDIEYGFPAYAFKQAMVRAAKPSPDVAMVDIKPAIHVLGDMAPLRGEHSRFDSHERNRNGQVVAVTYALWENWEADLKILHIVNAVSRENVINLLGNAGIWSGIGRRRPQAGGTNGMFEIMNVEVEEAQ